MTYDQPPVQQPPQYGQQPPQVPQYGAPQQYGQQYKQATEPLAIWALVTAFLFWPAGLVLSIMARKKIKNEGGEGAGLSLAGLIISIVGAVSTVIGVIAFVLISAASVATIGAAAAALEALPTDGSTIGEEPVASGPGSTRADPLAYGDPIEFLGEDGTTVEWVVSIAAPKWDATADVAVNDYNDPAPAGTVYVTVPVTYRNMMVEAKTPWLESDLQFVSADGRSFESSYAAMDGDVTGLGDLYEGGEATGTVLFAIPTDALTGGTFSVGYGWFSDPKFVAAS